MAGMIDYDDLARRHTADAAERERREALDFRIAQEHRIADWDRRARENRERYEHADIAAAEERRMRAQEQHDALQRAQTAWAEQRNALQDSVAEIRGLLAGAQGRVASAPIEDARIAAGEVIVYEERLKVAEKTLASHMLNQPGSFR